MNGLEWNGKGYDKNDNIKYELNNGKRGGYLKGKKNGKVKEYYNNGEYYLKVNIQMD